MKLPEEADCAGDEQKNIVPPTMNHQRRHAVNHESLPARTGTFSRFVGIARRADEKVRFIGASVSLPISVSSRETDLRAVDKPVAQAAQPAVSRVANPRRCDQREARIGGGTGCPPTGSRRNSRQAVCATNRARVRRSSAGCLRSLPALGSRGALPDLVDRPHTDPVGLIKKVVAHAPSRIVAHQLLTR